MPATYESLASTVVSGTSTQTISFTSISNAYTDLVIVLNCLGINGTGAVRVQFNSDTGANYSTTVLYADASPSVQSTATFSQSYMQLNAGYNVSATIPSLFKIDIFNYAGSTNKSIFSQASIYNPGSGAATAVSGLWRNTSAISSVQLVTSGNYFVADTTATLYGIKKA